jgi:hypothetical protein
LHDDVTDPDTRTYTQPDVGPRECAAPSGNKRLRTHGKPKACDFEGLEQMVLKAAQTEFQVRVCTKNAFPSDDESDLWAIECWQNGCEQKGEEFPLTDVHKKLVRVVFYLW